MIQRYHISKTPSGGSASWNTDDLRGVMLQLLVNPTTATTTYDITLTDDDSIVVYSKKGNKGTLKDTTQMGLYGIYTVDITNASVNEVFKFSLRFDELMR